MDFYKEQYERLEKDHIELYKAYINLFINAYGLEALKKLEK